MVQDVWLNADLPRQSRDAFCLFKRRFVVWIAVSPNAFLIIYLPCDGAWLAEHRPARFGIGVGVLRLTFVEKPKSERVDSNPKRVIIATLRVPTPIFMLRRFKCWRHSVDRQHVGHLPLPVSRGPESYELPEYLTRIVFGSADLNKIDVPGQITSARISGLAWKPPAQAMMERVAMS